MSVALVTDSTADIPGDVAAAHGIVVVPLQVVVGPDVYDEAEGAGTVELVAQALREWKPVTTSRPSPAAFLDVYTRAAESGASAVVSVHLSAKMSGTFESAQVAARSAPIPVLPVDSGQVGYATGLAVLAAARVLAAGGTAEQAAEAARQRAAATTSLFYVDTLEYLRRGGRIGAAAALLGGALSVKPLLRITDGAVTSFEKVRTAARALSRLEDLAVTAAGERPVDVYVGHLASPERAETLARALRRRLADNLAGREVRCGEVGAVLGAHVGPGMVAVCVAPALSTGGKLPLPPPGGGS